jgi:hypothetical protein
MLNAIGEKESGRRIQHLRVASILILWNATVNTTYPADRDHASFLQPDISSKRSHSLNLLHLFHLQGQPQDAGFVLCCIETNNTALS